MAQKDPDKLTEKLVSFVDYVGKAVASKGILEKDIIAMDETAVWFDMFFFYQESKPKYILLFTKPVSLNIYYFNKRVFTLPFTQVLIALHCLHISCSNFQ